MWNNQNIRGDVVIASYNTVNCICYVRRGLPKAAPTDLILSAHNIQCAVSDVQVTVLEKVSELASGNVAAVELAQLVTT